MKGIIKAAAIHEPVDLRLLPEGEYTGMWQKQLATAKVGRSHYWFVCDQGPLVQTPCVITVDKKTGVSVRLMSNR